MPWWEKALDEHALTGIGQPDGRERHSGRLVGLVAVAIVAVAGMGVFAWWVITDDSGERDVSFASREVSVEDLKNADAIVSVHPGGGARSAHAVRALLGHAHSVTAFAEIDGPLWAVTIGTNMSLLSTYSPTPGIGEPTECENDSAPTYLVDRDLDASDLPREAVAQLLQVLERVPDLGDDVTVHALPETLRLALTDGVDPRDHNARFEDRSPVEGVTGTLLCLE